MNQCKQTIYREGCLRKSLADAKPRPCSLPALDNGFCEVHQPERMLNRHRERIYKLEEQLKAAYEEEKRLLKLLHNPSEVLCQH